jgi:zinc protease
VIAVLLSAALAAPSKKSPPEPPPEPAPVVDPEAWRSSIPGPATESTWQPPVPETFQLSNGIPVVLIERHELPLVSVRLMMRAGRETAPDQPGLPTLTADLLDEGTRERDGARFAEAAGALGANLQSGQGGEYGWVLLDALAGEPLLPSLDLMVEMLREPSFAEFDRVRQAEIDQLAAASAVPGWHAERIASSELFGKDHPYGVLPSGTAESLSSLKKGHVKKFYKSWWQPANFALVVAGDVSRADLQEALETRLGDWKAKPGKAAEVAPPTPPASTRIVFRDHPGAVQSAIRVVSPGPSRTSDGYMPTLLAATIFGGMFSSPLNMNLREQHGWAYGAYAYLAEAKDYGRFTASAVRAGDPARAREELGRPAVRRDAVAGAGQHAQVGGWRVRDQRQHHRRLQHARALRAAARHLAQLVADRDRHRARQGRSGLLRARSQAPDRGGGGPPHGPGRGRAGGRGQGARGAGLSGHRSTLGVCRDETPRSARCRDCR